MWADRLQRYGLQLAAECVRKLHPAQILPCADSLVVSFVAFNIYGVIKLRISL